MKKIISFLFTIVFLIMIFLVGYKFIYKFSPRNFINKNTLVIYANEGVSTKDFNEMGHFILREKDKKEFEKIKKNLKYINNIYCYSEKDLNQLEQEDLNWVVDTGYVYPFITTQLEKYFDKDKDIWKLKKEYLEKTIFKDQNIYMENYKGLFILSLDKKNLKNFIEKRSEYVYNKTIENYMDENRDNILGVITYKNTNKILPGIDYIFSTGKIKNDKVIIDQNIILDDKTSKIFKADDQEIRVLQNYIVKNDIYVGVKDFSKIDSIIFGPYFLGEKINKNSFYMMAKIFFGIDVKKALKQIDGEAIFRNDNNQLAGIIKLKDKNSEIKKLANFLKEDRNLEKIFSGMYLTENNFLIFGNSEFKNGKSEYKLPKGTFLFGELDLSKKLELPYYTMKILGIENKIEIENILSEESIKTIQNKNQRNGGKYD